MSDRLPIEDVLPSLKQALARHNSVILQAPPGAGKTTLVPLALMKEPWVQDKKIIVLEPRRIAARTAASRMASLLNENVGETIGYRVRLDSQIGPATRIEVLTEGLLTRKLQSDPELKDVACLIFDEFHERSLHADLGLALALEVQSAFNETLKIIVMSATLEGAALSALLHGSPMIKSEGRLHPITTKYRPPRPDNRPDQSVAQAIKQSLDEDDGGILVFLPGEREIKNVAALLESEVPDSVRLLPLYGAMPLAAQEAAIRPIANIRKIVLATSIAETSLTIEDISVVIDGGLQRMARFDPASGMTRLVTERVSLASADQRRGRSGRTRSGICIRLWEEAATRSFAARTPPEILTSDLTSFALELAAWGVRDPATLRFLDAPPHAAWQEAQELLHELEAIDTNSGITPHGRRMLTFGAHPRLSHMMLRAEERDLGATAAALAAILTERDIVRFSGTERDADLRLRLLEFEAGHARPAFVSPDRSALQRAKQQAASWRRLLGATNPAIKVDAAGELAALAYPDRIAKRRGPGSFRLSNGRGASLPLSDPLANHDYLAVTQLDGAGANARIFQAAPLTKDEITAQFAPQIRNVSVIEWDHRDKMVLMHKEERFLSLVLSERPIKNPDPQLTIGAAITGIRSLGLKSLPWTKELDALRARVKFAHQLEPNADWPDFSEAALLAALEDWLAPFLSGITRATDFNRIDLNSALEAKLNWQQKKRLDELAPPNFTVPTGSKIRIDYTAEPPSLSVRLQELFGLRTTPAIADGRVALTLNLLSPAYRPVQITRDLEGFWKSSYAEVKRDLKGRYPKHFWPDDPLSAIPTSRAKPRPKT